MYKVPCLILVYEYLNSVFMLTDKGEMVVAIGHNWRGKKEKKKCGSGSDLTCIARGALHVCLTWRVELEFTLIFLESSSDYNSGSRWVRLE